MNLKLCALSCLFISSSVLAGAAQVNWHQPDKYTDIEPVTGTKQKFRQRIFNQFEQVFAGYSAQLAEHDQLKVTVTDLDLAGEVDYNFGVNQDLRIVKAIYWPALKFSYQVIRGGSPILTEEVSLRDMGFLERSRRTHRSEIYYEQKMLDRWWKQVASQLSQNKYASVPSD